MYVRAFQKEIQKLRLCLLKSRFLDAWLGKSTVDENDVKFTKSSHLSCARVYKPAGHVLLSHGNTLLGSQQCLDSCLVVRPTECRICDFKSLSWLRLATIRL